MESEQQSDQAPEPVSADEAMESALVPQISMLH
jgi:hypothetical protein